MKYLLLVLLYLFTSFSFADDLDNYIATCKDLGFKQGTEKLGDCVLELKRRDGGYVAPNAKRQNQSKSSNQTSNNQQYESQANEFFRQQQALYDKKIQLYNSQQAEYTLQKNEHDAMVAAAERQKEKEQGMKQLEMGLRMLAGESISDAAMGAARIPPLRVAPPSMPRMQFQENYRITTPNGGLVNCRYDPNIRQATCY